MLGKITTLTALSMLIWTEVLAQSVPEPSNQDVQRELARVRADPLLSHPETHKTLRFKKVEDKKEQTNSRPERKVDDDNTFIARVTRWFMWVFGIGTVIVVLAKLRGWLRVRADIAAKKSRMDLPSHVQSLDIRPESLPASIGSAAAALWQAGDQRGALSLLYRGALSRLVHEYALPIRSASTEGECLTLASSRLDTTRSDFFAKLVSIWQYAVYGNQMPENNQALGLFNEFDLQLGSVPSESVR
jgi:hypothetical protein